MGPKRNILNFISRISYILLLLFMLKLVFLSKRYKIYEREVAISEIHTLIFCSFLRNQKVSSSINWTCLFSITHFIQFRLMGFSSRFEWLNIFTKFSRDDLYNE